MWNTGCLVGFTRLAVCYWITTLNNTYTTPPHHTLGREVNSHRSPETRQDRYNSKHVSEVSGHLFGWSKRSSKKHGWIHRRGGQLLRISRILNRKKMGRRMPERALEEKHSLLLPWLGWARALPAQTFHSWMLVEECPVTVKDNVLGRVTLKIWAKDTRREQFRRVTRCPEILFKS